METQAISAPVERLTREAPKRQVGYGLPCAKCHKYFPADLEVCPICKGRERVSPVVASRIPKPVQSATSVAPPSSNHAVKQEVRESAKSESPTLVPPIEIKVKDQPFDQKQSIPIPRVTEIPAAVEPAPASLASTQPVLSEKEKESPKSESPTSAPPLEIKVRDQSLDLKESITTPVVADIPAIVEPARTTLVSAQTEKDAPKLESPAFAPPVAMKVNEQPLEQKETIPIPAVSEPQAVVEPKPASLVSTQKEKESPKSESPTSAPPLEIKVKDQPLDQKEPITIPVVAEIHVAVEPAPATLVSTQTENEAPKSESPAFAPVEVHTVESRAIQVRAENQPLDHKESTTIPVVAEIPAAAEPASTSLVSTQFVLTQKEKESPKSESPAFTAPIEIKVKDQPLDHKESITVPVIAELPAAVEPARASLVSTQKAKESPKSEPPAVTCLNDQLNSEQPNRKGPIATPALVEARTSDPVPTAIVARSKEEERTTELEAPAAALPILVDTEGQRRDKINQALRIVIPMLAETQVSEPAPVAAKQEVLEREKKEQAPKMSEAPMSASEVKIAEAKPVETKIVEVKTVASPAVVDQATHCPSEEKSKAIDKRVDAPPKPADVNAPVVVHVNLGELRASKSTRERAPAQSKEIERSEPESSNLDISADAYASESPAPVGGRKLDLVTFALGVVVLACAVLLIALAAIRLMPRHASEPVRRAKAAYSSGSPTADENPTAPIPTTPPAAAASVDSASSNFSPVVGLAAAPAQPPVVSPSSLPSSAGSERVLTLSEGLAEGNLLYRVEPDYPEEARRQGVQGPVVLDLHISKDGLVQGVDLVSGQPLLAQAATAAVKQWRFRTRYVNGNEVEMQARITLHFALPTP
jgi:TonB family protein